MATALTASAGLLALTLTLLTLARLLRISELRRLPGFR
ncbi:hypothetical protein J2Z21_003778 [Streptomyces griseochromogenes]|uniref:Uncharacterized protein n=1 Tax=Streptomyces griseochromogenes TaxID=68214 RepID=A0ABS4LTU6_9ACTN|nr:hypothetical protein [Streptomyces griseochromogenes]